MEKMGITDTRADKRELAFARDTTAGSEITLIPSSFLGSILADLISTLAHLV